MNPTDQFPRIQRLPPYVFNIVNELKAQARKRGEDIIDFGMGNPDQPTPQHIVDKMIEAAKRGDTHRYSVSKGIPRLRKAICTWYKRRYGVALNSEKEAIVTIGSKEGLSHLALATVDKGDAVRTLIAGCRTGAFAGDDTGDLPAFSSLTDAVRAGTLERAVRIGVTSSEAPPELAAAVDILVDGPGGLVALLERVADEIV